jgi:hypothetical protein
LYEPDGHGGQLNPAQVIDQWHQQRGFHRDTYWRGRQNPNLVAIGYHFVIARNGVAFTGRHLDEVGAHVDGWNTPSIGICLVGIDAFTPDQYATLTVQLRTLAKMYGIPLAPPQFGSRAGVVSVPGICGHRDIPGVTKSCPGFTVSDFLKGL